MPIRRKMIKVYYLILMTFTVPLLIPFLFASNKQIIKMDARRWSEVDMLTFNSDIIKVIYFLSIKKEFRNLYYYRLKNDSLLTEILALIFRNIYHEISTLIIDPLECGPGLYIQHGISTIICSRRIGKNCIINQQVTIGYKGKDNIPHIGDNVRISCGAKVIGNITIGDNSIIGANAVVVKNVPANCVVVGVPAYIIKKDGIRVKESL